MGNLSGTFNILCFAKTAKRDMALMDEWGVPCSDKVRLAFGLGLEAERHRLKCLHAMQSYTYRAIDEHGRMRYEEMNPSGKASSAPMAYEDIMALRDPAERAYDQKMREVLLAGAPSVRHADNQNNLLEARPSDKKIVTLSQFKDWKSAKKAFVGAVIAKAGLGPYWEESRKSFLNHLGTMVESLAQEKMAQKMKLVAVIEHHGHELFGKSEELRINAMCRVLVRPLQFSGRDNQGNSTEDLFLPIAELLFPKNAGQVDIGDRTNDADRSHALLRDYHYFSNKLFYPSGIADLSKTEKEQVVVLCRDYMTQDAEGMPGFMECMKKAATHTHNLIVNDLFFPADLKQKYRMVV